MINYSITMRSVNSNLIADAEFNLVASQRSGCSHQGHQGGQSQRGHQHSNYSWRRLRWWWL